jgi:hypothetical protein
MQYGLSERGETSLQPADSSATVDPQEEVQDVIHRNDTRDTVYTHTSVTDRGGDE